MYKKASDSQAMQHHLREVAKLSRSGGKGQFAKKKSKDVTQKGGAPARGKRARNNQDIILLRAWMKVDEMTLASIAANPPTLSSAEIDLMRADVAQFDWAAGSFAFSRALVLEGYIEAALFVAEEIVGTLSTAENDSGMCTDLARVHMQMLKSVVETDTECCAGRSLLLDETLRCALRASNWDEATKLLCDYPESVERAAMLAYVELSAAVYLKPKKKIYRWFAQHMESPPNRTAKVTS